jgi:hypothetical protein
MTHRFRRRFRGAPHAFIGILLISLGVLFLLANLNVLDARDLIRRYWPVLIIVWGLVRLVVGQGDRVIGSIAVFVGAILLGNRVLGWDINLFGFWPLVLIALGINLLFRAWRQPSYMRARVSATPGDSVEGGAASGPLPDGRTDASASLREFAILGGFQRRNVSQTFRGGEVTAVMGGGEIDLRECRMAGDEVQVDVFALLGGFSLQIPRDWTVESRVSAVLGGFEDHSAPPVAGASGKLVLSGYTILGGIEIKN